MSPLDDTTVVDLSTGVAGPLAARLLGSFGARVVKARAVARTPASVVFDHAKEPLGDRDRDDLLREADVCVVSAGRSALAGTALDPDRLTAANPRLVYLHTPPYLDDAPWAGGGESDELLSAITGVALRQASVGGGPTDSIYPNLLTVQGIWAAAAAVGALYERQSSGLGQVVTVGGIHGALVAAAGAFTFDPASALAAAADSAGRRPGGSGGSVPFYRTYRCGDGEWLFLAALTPRFTAAAFGVLGLSDLLDDPRLEGKGRAGLLAPEHLGWVIQTIADVFAGQPRQHWLDALHAAGCPAAPLLQRDEWLDHPQIEAIGMRVEVKDPELGPVVMPGIPINLVPPDAIRPSKEGAAGATAGGADGSAGGVLAGVRVLDLGAIIAGPFSASLLADLGADVIKVEPLTGDSFRGPGFAAYNKGQRGVALDLQKTEGRDAFLALVRDADIVIDNYRPGVLGRLRITYDDLMQVNPRIITLSVTGFGEGGPLGGEPGFDPVAQAMSGMMRAQGGEDTPVFFTVPINDVAASAAIALGACVALLARTRTGVGQRGWAALAGMSALLQAGEIVRYEGRPPARAGGTDFKGPDELDRFYEVADGWVRVRADEASPLLAEVAALTRDEAVGKLTASRVESAPARRVVELAGDRELWDYGILHRDTRPGRETWVTAGRHARFSRTERAGTLVSPSLGEHTREVLTQAGFDDAAIDGLIAAGAAAEAREAARQ